jgi:hypothetical protein
MSQSVPSAKQSLADIVLQRFPWLAGVVYVGKGLAIRAAGGLLHLAGGPGDAAVVRVGDAGTGGTIEVVGGTSIKFTNAAGETLVIPFSFAGGAVVVGPAVPPTPFNLATKSTEGSAKVTCG